MAVTWRSIWIMVCLFFLGTGTTQADGHPRFLIRYVGAPSAADEAYLKTFGGEVIHRYQIVPALAVQIPAGAVDTLARNGRIVRIEPDARVQAVDAELNNSWQVTDIHADTVQAAGNSGAGVRVAILDTGADLSHFELAIAGGYDFVNNDGIPQDDNGHGTHVAGIIAAAKNASGMVGVAPQVTLYSLKVLDSSGSGYFGDIIAALDWCVSHGIQVTNNSYGSSQDPGLTVHEAFDNAYAAGILQIAAAGNSGTFQGKGNNVNFPGAYSSVVAIAAVDASNKRAYFSSTGSAVELAAPGVNIYSTWPGGGFTTLSGTSMATPAAVGAAALVWASGITDLNGNGNLNDEVRNRLGSTAADLGTAGRDTLYGFGLVNAAAAVAGFGTVTQPPPPSGGALSVAVATDKAAYRDHEQVRITVNVQDGNGAPVAGASVSVTILTPSGRKLGASGSTDSAGIFRSSYGVKISRDGAGTYQVSASGSLTGFDPGSGTTSFTAN